MSYLPEEGVDELGEGAHGVQLQLDLAKEAEVHIRRGQADLAGVGRGRGRQGHLGQVLVEDEGSDVFRKVEGVHKLGDD